MFKDLVYIFIFLFILWSMSILVKEYKKKHTTQGQQVYVRKDKVMVT